MKKIIFSIIIGIFLVGCSAKGPQFTEMKQIDNGKAKVYVYRNAKLVGSGVSFTTWVQNGDKNITLGELKSGGYLETEIAPNKETKVWAKTEVKRFVDLMPKENQIYCIRTDIGIGFLMGRPKLEVVDYEICKEELKKTKLSSN